MNNFKENLNLRKDSILSTLNRFRNKAPYMHMYFANTIFMVTGQIFPPMVETVIIGSKSYSYQTTVSLSENLETQLDTLIS